MKLKDITGDEPVVPLCPNCKDVPLFSDTRWINLKENPNFLYCRKCLHVYRYENEV